jgi:CheY-like chemotaxis protein
MNILLVDDDDNSRVFLERTLTKEGHSVSTATNGVQALEKAGQQLPDMIISDIMMPEMDGFELCRRVKSDSALRAIPFVFYTATFVDKRDEQLAMALGASGFIVKPMEIDPFLSIVDEVLNRHEERKLPTPEKPRESEAGKNWIRRLGNSRSNGTILPKRRRWAASGHGNWILRRTSSSGRMRTTGFSGSMPGQH